MKLRVTNKQKYQLGRRGYVFPPGETVDIEVASEHAVNEIAASRYLDVTVLDSGSPQSQPTQSFAPEATVESSELHDKTVVELRELAADKGIEVPPGTVKADLVAMLVESEDD